MNNKLKWYDWIPVLGAYCCWKTGKDERSYNVDIFHISFFRNVFLLIKVKFLIHVNTI